MADNCSEVKNLVDRARNLDREAFGQLYDLYYDRIYKYAYFRVGNLIDAEDLTAQVFTGALKTIKNFSWRKSSFTSWLFRIANNVVADFWRQRGRAIVEPLEKYTSLSNGEDITDTVAKNFQFEKLRLALAKLPAEQSQVVILRFINGLSTQETAEAMEKSVGAVKALQFRALQRLRELLVGENDD